MDEEETKTCPNCKRDIPAVNFTIHSVHCARNIKVCPVCKEPVPVPELDDHHKKMHKLLPCKQCGESVCGTDLEDHIRDSCANTVKSCRFCELELPRRELPTHEGYCGVRTEQCPDCKEYVMIKYQQLHLDSNHGFIKLDDDPAPIKKELPKLNIVKPLSKSNLNRPNASPSNGPKSNNIAQRPTSIFDDFPGQSDNRRPTSSNSGLDSSRPSHVTNVPSSSNSVLNSSMFGNPRPYVRPSSNSGPSSSNSGLNPSTFGNPRPYVRSSSNSGPNSFNSGFGSSDSRPSSSNVKPNSPDDGMISSNSGSSPKNTGLALLKTRLESFDSRQGPICATPLQWPSPSDSGSGSPNFRPGSPNFRPDSSNSGPSSSNARPGSSNATPSSSNTRPSNFDIAGNSRILANTNNIRNTKTEFKHQGTNNTGGPSAASNISPQEVTASVVRATNGVKKRTNDQPQINMDTSATKTVHKDLGAVSRGAVKKRPAPQPPRVSSRRDLPYYSAMHRQQTEERQRREQNEYNLAHGLPPVLNPAQKVEKLRKMDALQNRDFEEEYRSRQRRPSPERGCQEYDAGRTLGTYQDMDEATRQEFKNLKPMSPNQFMKRFSSLQVSPPPRSGDRFPEIKSSLRELRRELNEVTAPYNAYNNTTAQNNNDAIGSPSPLVNEDVQLPCEFCAVLVPADDLVQHQTGCRPDLAQFVPGARALAPSPRAAALPAPAPRPPRDPVIPCEFCMESLPVYLIAEHQERCIQENMPI